MPTVYNKVTYNAATLLSLETDTITAADLRQGVTAHDAHGNAIVGSYTPGGATIQSNKNATPSTSQQVVTPDSGYDALAQVTVAAMPSGTAGTPTATKGAVDDGYGITVTPSVTNSTGYITGGTKTGTGVRVTAREIVSGESITADDSGEWDVANYETLTIPDGTAGTPSATKGTVSNHTVSVTPSVTNSTGWINGGTKTGSAVTVSASELVSGTLSVTSSGTKDVTTYASASIPAGTAGTPTATKGSVSNHSISVTPSVTNSTGFITGSTKSGTAVTVSASELVSGTLSVSQNGTQNVTTYASVNVAIPIVTYYTGTSAPASSLGQNGDIYLRTVN